MAINKKHFEELLEKYEAGDCNENEKQLLIEFYGAYQKNQDWHKELGDREILESELLEKINSRIINEENAPVVFNKRRPLLRIAVIMAIALIASFVLYQYSRVPDNKKDQLAIIEKVTQRGQKSTIILSDGTQIKLNSDSKIVYPERFENEKREVLLEGEAFFDVSKDEKRPFIIKSANITTTVLGTSFNVKAFPKEMAQVTVATGKVQVTSDKSQSSVKSHLLVPGEQVNYDPSSGQMYKNEVDIERFLAWKDGILNFEEMKLHEAAKILERWYGVSITFDNEAIRNCRIVKGTYYKGENLFNVLKSFQYFLGFEYKVVDGNYITISGNGC
ncbi:FecR domain-containing protein [Fulvivirgaceae bacterium BMA10]|uniref:FecR domain-containing protein n=1 Tax=Splendidivirga corallicola TaxID=3051826 RepID=A0ABT8L266_9BACT|nr:FecR domain-containing protein [Fulvivirgaceae bacterium BMA10]